jgi:ABC-type Fe3+ transport system permease subunit
MTAFFTVLWSALAVLFLRRVPRFFEFVLTLPAGVSSISLALGFWLAFARWIDPFEGSLGALIAIQSVIFSPIVLRTFLPIAAATPVSALGVARSVGASRWQAFWWVDWPRWRMPVWNSLFLVCSASLGEVAVVSFFGSENLTTVSGLISRWMGLYQFDQAYWLSAFLMGLVLVFSLAGGFFEQKSRDFFVR